MDVAALEVIDRHVLRGVIVNEAHDGGRRHHLPRGLLDNMATMRRRTSNRCRGAREVTCAGAVSSWGGGGGGGEKP